MALRKLVLLTLIVAVAQATQLAYAGSSQDRLSADLAKKDRMAYTDGGTTLTITATFEEYKKWVFELLTAPTESINVTVPDDDFIVSVVAANPDAFDIVLSPTPQGDPGPTSFIMRSLYSRPVRTDVTVTLNSGQAIHFDVSSKIQPHTVKIVQCLVAGRTEKDAYIRRKEVALQAKWTLWAQNQAADLAKKIKFEARNLNLRAMITHNEIRELGKVGRNGDIQVKAVDKTLRGDEVYVRFLVRNNSSDPFQIETAYVELVRGRSFLGGKDKVKHYMITDQNAGMSSSLVQPLEEKMAIVVFSVPQLQEGDQIDLVVKEKKGARNVRLENVDLGFD